MKIRRNKRWDRQPWLALLVVAMLFCLGAPLRGQSAVPQTDDSDVTQHQVASLDRFLDSHPEIAEQLRRNPSLISNEKFVQSHPTLQEFLQQHPGVREEFSENPQAFMRQEQRFERREEGREGVMGDNDITRRKLAGMDNFLDSHPEIAEQLRRNPSLISNEKFVESHPALQQFLQVHPEVSEQFRANPQSFMQREERFEQREDRSERMGDRDRIRAEANSFSGFLGTHSQIAQEVTANPTLVNNKEFLERHGELREYVNAHPVVKQELTDNPQGFMSAVQQAGNGSTGKVIAPKQKKHQ